MLKALKDILNGMEDNYLLPFYWQHGNHHEKIPEQIERIRQSGCRALCVESRPHPDYCEDGWWADMDLILSECRKRDMKVWVLDDSHFPTGNCVGKVKEHPELHRKYLLHHKLDVMGPMRDAQLLIPALGEGESLYRVIAMKRTDEPYDPMGNYSDGERMTGEPIDLTDRVRGRWLFWDLPEGCWRIFFLLISPRGSREIYNEWDIDNLNPESCQLLVDTVYEAHYAHYAEYFGNTFQGFFSDEPGWNNIHIGPDCVSMGDYFLKIGMQNLALPYSEETVEMMTARLGSDAALLLPCLWYPSERSPEIRYTYMDVITRQYERNFTMRLGNWCRAHSVKYIGHIIEDNNAHGRMGYGAGHYFRSLHGQDMSGIDIVLHQIMPGMAHYDSAFPCAWSAANARFFHYILGKLGASMSHLDPLTEGRAMCEVFGAYGWAEGVPMMKWLMDYLLVRGVNWFVPHAFSPEFPDPDCPPHMGAEGHDPQFEGFKKLMAYTNRAAHLLSGGVHRATAAILYHAELEWMNYACMTMEQPACVLYDRQIDYDIVSMDLLENAAAENGQLCIGGERFEVLILPCAKRLPSALVTKLDALREAGVRVWFVDALPENANGEVVPLSGLADRCTAEGICPVSLDRPFDFLRVYHYAREGSDVYMLTNESTAETCERVLSLPSAGRYLVPDLLNGGATRGNAPDGKIVLSLQPGESLFVVFGVAEDEWSAFPEPTVCTERIPLVTRWSIERAGWENLDAFAPYRADSALFNLTGADGDPDFSGQARYTAAFRADGALPTALDLGQVGQTASVTLNGRPLGIRIAQPYRFDLRDAVRPGENTLEITVANTLGNAMKDRFSEYVQTPPSGLIGPVELLK